MGWMFRTSVYIWLRSSKGRVRRLGFCGEGLEGVWWDEGVVEKVEFEVGGEVLELEGLNE
jgi:hypothetical protein